MCDINAFIVKEGREVKVLENVDVVTQQGEEITLTNIFGEQKRLTGRLSFYNNTQKKMVFQSA